MSPDALQQALTPERWPALILVTARVSGLFVAAPLWSMTMMPKALRAALIVALSVLLLPSVPPVHVPAATFDLPLPIAIELLIGVAIGFSAGVLVQGAAFAGELLGVQMGLTLGPSVMVLPELPSSDLGHLLGLFATVVYLGLDGHLALLAGLAESLRALPPAGAIELSGGAHAAAGALGVLFSTAASVAAPVLATLMLTHVGLALLNRAVPQLNSLMNSFPITIGAGLVMLGLALPVMTSAFADRVVELPAQVERLVGAFTPRAPVAPTPGH